MIGPGPKDPTLGLHMPRQRLYSRYPGHCTDICRVVRMLAKAKFLREPQPGFIAYAALSAGFVPNPSHSDVFMFSVKSVGPVALHMLSAMQRHHTDRFVIETPIAYVHGR